MVNIGIIGAETPMAGELIRILINHPETDIKSLYAPLLLGRNVASIHHGLIGETSLNFTDKININDINLLFILKDYPILKDLLEYFKESEEELKIISFISDDSDYQNVDKKEIGISEINRKALVRGAKYAYLVPTLIVPSLIALIPLANFLLLNSDINIEIEAPEDILNHEEPGKLKDLLENQIRRSQISFNDDININVSPNLHSDRGMVSKISFKNNLSLDELEKIYEGIYDDHNFTFLTHNEINIKEVEGTQKVIIYLDKPDSDTLNIYVIADSRMRGGAGDAVHVMNLFFGLHEKTGLHLKPSRF